MRKRVRLVQFIKLKRRSAWMINVQTVNGKITNFERIVNSESELREEFGEDLKC